MLDRIENLIKKTLRRDDIVIAGETDIVDALGLNSLELAELVCAVEDEFGVEISDRDIRSFRVVSNIITYLEKNG